MLDGKKLSIVIKEKLKQHGYKLSDFSIRSGADRVDITIKNLQILDKDIYALVRQYESIDKDEITGEILSGGNMYIFVKYDWTTFNQAAREMLPVAENAAKLAQDLHGYITVMTNADSNKALMLCAMKYKDGFSYSVHIQNERCNINTEHICEISRAMVRFKNTSTIV